MLGVTIGLCAIAISIFAVGIQVYTLRRVVEEMVAAKADTPS
ncbi:MAG: hypothetical protein R3C01_01285 [Planctomycetaceae bacterium]